MSKVCVELGEESYDVVVETGAMDRVGAAAAEFFPDGRALVVSDRRVGELYGSRVLRSLRGAGVLAEIHLLPVGERTKSLATARRLYNLLISAQFGRRSGLVALGGGVVGDLAGYVAATYLRGIAFIGVPTTLVAQVDASIGGKTGVNLPQGKNLIGAFHQPRAVLCDPVALDTLPARDYWSGLAEVIKHAVVRDAEYFDGLEEHLDAILARRKEVLEGVVQRSCAIKAAVVSADVRECGERAILNLGHTFGHGIEAAGGYRRFRHGEAVALGMVAACHLAVAEGYLNTSDAHRIAGLIEGVGLRVRCAGVDRDAVLRAMSVDKKSQAGRLRFVLPTRIGHVEIVTGISQRAIRKALRTIGIS